MFTARYEDSSGFTTVAAFSAATLNSEEEEVEEGGGEEENTKRMNVFPSNGRPAATRRRSGRNKQLQCHNTGVCVPAGEAVGRKKIRSPEGASLFWRRRSNTIVVYFCGF